MSWSKNPIIKQSSYIYNSKKHPYISSNSPIIHIMMQEYDHEDLEIILLATKETQETNDLTIEYSDNHQEQYSNISFVEYLKKELQDAYHLEALENDTSVFKRGSHKIIFKEFPLDMDKQYEAITSIVNEINTIPKDKIDHLWIDPHGGPRNINVTMLGLLSLLHNFHITPEYVFDLKYDNDTHIATIKNNDDIYTIYNFVSAMNTFYNSQNADLLIDYLNSTDKGKVSAANNTAKALKVISDGLQFCNSELYKTGINDLHKTLVSLKNDNSYVSLFNDFIEAEFNDGEFQPLRTIERCLNNSLYQQTLTFIESFIPDEIAKYKIIYLSKEDYDHYESYKNNNKNKILNKNETLNKIVLNKLGDELFPKQTLATLKGQEDINEINKLYFQLIPIINTKLKNIETYNAIDSSFIPHDITFNLLSNTNKNYTVFSYNSNPTFTCILHSNIKKTDSYYYEAVLSLIMFFVILKIRNNVSHSNKTVLDYDQIIQFLKHYIEITKDLFEKVGK